MNHQVGHRALVLSLISFVILSLVLVLVLPFGGDVSADDIRSRLDSLDEEPGGPASMRERACELATLIFSDSAECSRFADEVVKIHFDAQNVDFLLVYNTGGFGGGTMADDPEWPTVLEGIKAELATSGYESMIVEHQRGKGGLIGFLDELEEIKCDYRTEAPELAAKAAFLTKYNPELKVVLTGRCFGAVISNEVMELTAENPQLYSIQAGRPFWYTDPGGERTLVIEDNGVMPDILNSRGVLHFLWTLFKANLGHFLSASPPDEGSFKAVNWYLKAPGHTYTWNHPGVRTRIMAFLEQNFGNEH
ncbi:MAG: hypothetical protein ISS53_01400 [Dehalococcoidia bacterium]|nr:hypothetical protein [Dehalococcoidia bacterium]